MKKKKADEDEKNKNLNLDYCLSIIHNNSVGDIEDLYVCI